MKDKRINKAIIKVALFSILFYSFNIGLIKSFNALRSISVALLFSSYIATLSIIIGAKVNKKIMKDLLLSFVIIVFGVILRNSDLSNGVYLDPFGICMIIAFFPVLKNIEGWSKDFEKILKIFFLEHIICTYLFFIFKDFYRQNIIGLFPIDYREQLLYQFQHNEIAGITANFSHNGMYLALATMFYYNIWLNAEKDNRRNKIIVFIVSLGALLLTGKRAHFLFILPAILVMTLLKIRKEKNEKTKIIKRIVGAGAIVSGIILILLATVPGFRTTFDRLEYLTKASDITNGRQVMYDRAMEMWEESPLIGNGWGSVKYKNKYDGNMLNVHNVYIQVLAENGIIGEIIFLIIIVIIIKKIMSGTGNDVEILCMGYVIFFVLYSFTGNPLYDPQVLYPVVLSIASSTRRLEK